MASAAVQIITDDEIAQFIAAYERAWDKGRYAGLISLYTDSASIMSATGLSLLGERAVRAAYRRNKGEFGKTKLKYDLLVSFINPEEARALVMVKWHMRWHKKAGKRNVGDTCEGGCMLTLVRRNGVIRIDCDNTGAATLPPVK